MRYGIYFILFFLYYSLVTCEDDYYKILGITRNANLKEIKQAYRRMSLKTHPDRNQGSNSTSEFSKVARAYEILSDPEKKKKYDTYGEAGLSDDRYGSNFQNNDFFNFFRFPFDSMYTQKKNKKTKNSDIELYLSLEQLFFGDILTVTVQRPVICKHFSSCTVNQKDCIGPGVKLMLQMYGSSVVIQTQVSDPSCIDEGKSWNNSCKKCPNGPTEMNMTKTTLLIQPGMTDGDILRSNNLGIQSIGLDPGDIIYTVRQIPHFTYKRIKNDLHVIVDITLLEALTGFEKEFVHISQKVLKIKKESITRDRQKEVVIGLGMPVTQATNNYDSPNGNLIITYNVLYPDVIDSGGKKIINQLFSHVKSWSKETKSI